MKKHVSNSLLILVGVLLVLGLINVASSEPEKQMMTTDRTEVATFAGGCFWCVESDFDKVAGVKKTVSGYIGGHKLDPTYQQVSSGGTGHTEAVQITFDPNQVSYQQLLEIFWRSIDPTTTDRQFCDRGDQYRTAIFYNNAEQGKWAKQSKDLLDKIKPFRAPIVTEIAPATLFYAAEDYHQNYYKKNPLRYKYYRYSCGRDQHLEKLWGDKG